MVKIEPRWSEPGEDIFPAKPQRCLGSVARICETGPPSPEHVRGQAAAAVTTQMQAAGRLFEWRILDANQVFPPIFDA